MAALGPSPAAVDVDPDIVGSYSRDRIVRLDVAARTAVVQPGVLNEVLAAEAAARGLFYAPDPASCRAGAHARHKTAFDPNGTPNPGKAL